MMLLEPDCRWMTCVGSFGGEDDTGDDKMSVSVVFVSRSSLAAVFAFLDGTLSGSGEDDVNAVSTVLFSVADRACATSTLLFMLVVASS